MNRVEAVNSIRNLEKKHDIYSLTRLGYSVYQLITVAITMNLITDQSSRTNEGRIGNFKKKFMSFRDVKKEEPTNINVTSKDSVLFMLRGKYSSLGIDQLLDDYYSFYKEEGKLKPICIDRVLDGVLSENIYDTAITTSHFKYLGKQFVKRDIVNWSSEEKNKITEFSKDLLKIGYNGWDFEKLLTMKTREFLVERMNYTIFLKANNVNKIYLSLGYVNLGLLAAAKELSIETNEIQYANISDLHNGFSFSDERVLTADNLILWGTMYGSDFKNNKSKLSYRCPKYLQNAGVIKKEQILVVVQKLEYKIFEELAKILTENNKNIPIVFKMPLGVNFEKSYIENIRKHGVHISYFNEKKTTMQYIQESKWVISGYSTALIEAVTQGSIPISWQKVPNSEEFKPYILSGIMYDYTPKDITSYEFLESNERLFKKKTVKEVLEEIDRQKI